MLTCAGCATSQQIRSPVYPPAPAFLAPVTVPELDQKQDTRVLLAKDRAALLRANRNLINSRDWYNNLAK